MTQLLLYLPVIHAGYQRFLEEHARDAEVLLVGRSFAAEHPVVGKEIRALDPATALRYLTATGVVARGRVVERDDLPGAVDGPLRAPDEALLREIVDGFGLGPVQWVPTFLSWDREWSRAGRPPRWDGAVTADAYARRMQELAATAAARSSDWWRRVGAVAARDGAVLAVEHNRHLPTEYAPYLDGDPRNSFRRGVAADRTTAIHAEAAVIARAAREGLRLHGADLHVSTFPCPACARLVAEAGFARCFFAGGYSVLHGDDVLRAAGVELVFVEGTGVASATPVPPTGSAASSA
jgi:deoxycytidylate deaminase